MALLAIRDPLIASHKFALSHVGTACSSTGYSYSTLPLSHSLTLSLNSTGLCLTVKLSKLPTGENFYQPHVTSAPPMHRHVVGTLWLRRRIGGRTLRGMGILDRQFNWQSVEVALQAKFLAEHCK